MIITNYHPILMIITNYHLICIIITIYSIMKDVGDVVLGVLAIVCFIVGTVSNSAILSFFISKKHDKYEDFPVVISLHLLFFFFFFSPSSWFSMFSWLYDLVPCFRGRIF